MPRKRSPRTSKGKGGGRGTRSRPSPRTDRTTRPTASRRYFKPFFLDRLKIGPLIGQRLGSHGIHGYGESEEYLVRRGHVRSLEIENERLNDSHKDIESMLRGAEVWHRYHFKFEDRYDLDDIFPIFSRYMDPVLKPFYNTFAILKVEIAVTDDRGRIIAEGLRSVSAIFEYQDLADSITYNVNNWVKKGDYDTVLGMIIELRAPQWYEHKRLREIADGKESKAEG